MGRYYEGDIRGKFWFSVQSSDDASSFGVEPEYLYEFHGCGCSIEIFTEHDDTLNDSLYCHTCYTSLKHHCEDIQTDNTWYCRELSYSFYIDHQPMVQAAIQRLTQDVGKYMKGYQIVGDVQDGFEYDYTISNDASKHITQLQREKIARLCLGRLIDHCLTEKGTCFFTAEI